jgi:hypothetical protein
MKRIESLQDFNQNKSIGSISTVSRQQLRIISGTTTSTTTRILTIGAVGHRHNVRSGWTTKILWTSTLTSSSTYWRTSDTHQTKKTYQRPPILHHPLLNHTNFPLHVHFVLDFQSIHENDDHPNRHHIHLLSHHPPPIHLDSRRILLFLHTIEFSNDHEVGRTMMLHHLLWVQSDWFQRYQSHPFHLVRHEF